MNQEHFVKSYLEFTPCFNNLFFFNKQRLAEHKYIKQDAQHLKQILENSHNYESFLKQKGRRPTFDIYASFQPFNEATKALFPFLKQLQNEVKPKDIILNLWDRTGWLTNVLCAFFPEQKIVTTWEGDKDVLGYKGYSFWMQKHKNLEIVFHDPEKALPFKDNSIAFSVGLDLLHRFDQVLLLNELNRVVSNSGAILFPHVHLSNNEPEPFFDRGGIQLHGNTYQNLLNSIFKTSNREGYIFSEPELFVENDIKQSKEITIISKPNTTDYNALIAILPDSWKTKTLSAYTIDDNEQINQSYVLVNMLVDINLSQNHVSINRALIEGQIGYLLDRHPIYLNRINGLHDLQLTDLAVKCIFLAKKGFNIEEISNKTNCSISEIISELKHLENLGLVQVLPLSRDAVRLQYYLMSQEYILTKDEQTFPTFWKKTVKQYSNHIALLSMQDDSEFTYEDCNDIIHSIGLRLEEENLTKGDRILICSEMHTEPIFLLWACLNRGISVVPIHVDLPITQINHIIKEAKPKRCFFGESVYQNMQLVNHAQTHILFDEDDNQFNQLYFSEWLDELTLETHSATETIIPEDEAVILYTSGSTGVPKGVKLPHGNLIRSGRLITETFHWNTEDRFFCLGTLNTMSGLRNSTISSLHVGGSIVIPKASDLKNSLLICEAIHQSQASILGSNPTFINQLVKYKPKIKGQINSIKTIICTGNLLSNTLRAQFLAAYKLPIHNYYGLTETTGICLSQYKGETDIHVNTIGRTTDAIAQVVNETNTPVNQGEIGELRIFSENLMLGYLNQDSKTALVIKDGWFYTNDLVKFINHNHLELIGRKRTIIKTKSEELIYLSEIQNYMLQLPIIQDVYIHPIRKEAHEEVVAFVVLHQNNLQFEQAIDSIKKSITQNLGKFKTPNQFINLSELPYNSDGKLSTQLLLNKLNEL